MLTFWILVESSTLKALLQKIWVRDNKWALQRKAGHKASDLIKLCFFPGQGWGFWYTVYWTHNKGINDDFSLRWYLLWKFYCCLTSSSGFMKSSAENFKKCLMDLSLAVLRTSVHGKIFKRWNKNFTGLNMYHKIWT